MASAWLMALGLLACSPAAPDALPPAANPPAASAPLPWAAERVVRTRLTMGTLVRYVVLAPDESVAEEAIELASASMERVVALASEWEPDSEVSRVNAAAGQGAVPVSIELLDLLSQAQEVSARSDGAFDVTWAAMRGVWRFDGARSTPPASADIEAAVARVDYRKLVLESDPPTARLLEPSMALGLGGIAKGLAIHEAARALRSAGIEAFVIDAGGDIYAEGSDAGEPWLVAIAHPRREAEILATVAIAGQALVTSGDYQRYFERDGVRYHHIIDPRTGYPARGLVSVSVLHPDPTLADALATAAFVLGPERGQAFLEGWPGAEGLLVDDALTIRQTTGWPDR